MQSVVLPETVPLTERQFHFTYQNPIARVAKRDEDVCDAAEAEMKEAGISFKLNANLALAKALRQNIQDTLHSVKRSMFCLRIMDWFLFITASVFLSVVAIGSEYPLTAGFSLAQLLAILALFTKSAEKFLNLSSLASKKLNQLKELESLIRRLSVIQMQFYLELAEDSAVNRLKVASEIHTIWALYSNLESGIFLSPVRGEEPLDKVRSMRVLDNKS